MESVMLELKLHPDFFIVTVQAAQNVSDYMEFCNIVPI